MVFIQSTVVVNNPYTSPVAKSCQSAVHEARPLWAGGVAGEEGFTTLFSRMEGSGRKAHSSIVHGTYIFIFRKRKLGYRVRNSPISIHRQKLLLLNQYVFLEVVVAN